MEKTETWGSPVDFKGCSYGPGRARFITFGPEPRRLPFGDGGHFAFDLKPAVTTEQAKALWDMLEDLVDEFSYTGPLVEDAPIGRGGMAQAAREPLEDLLRSREAGRDGA